MSLLQNTIALVYLILFVISLCSFTVAAPSTDVTELAKDNSLYIMTAILPRVDINYIERGKKKDRVKRQGSNSGKFVEAAKLPPSKVMQMYLQMFKSLLSGDPTIGDVRLLSTEAAKPLAKIFKEGYVGFFFPDEKENQNEQV